MATISRFIPNSSPTRLKVLTKAKEKKDGMPPAENILSATTTARLDVIQPQFATALALVSTRSATSIVLTANKNAAGVVLRQFCSHYLQVFNLAVDRGVYPKGTRAVFNLNTETGTLPNMDSDADAEQVAKNIALGEAQLVLGGLPPMANPTATEVATKLTDFRTAYTEHSNASQDLDKAQEAVDTLVPEADKVIKKIYDEAEAHYNEEEPESMRADCEWWGVIYISIGNEKQLTVVLKNNAGAQTPIAGYAIKLVQAAGKTLVTPANGTVVFTTKVVGEATLNIYPDPAYTQGEGIKQQTITITEDVPQTVEVLV